MPKNVSVNPAESGAMRIPGVTSDSDRPAYFRRVRSVSEPAARKARTFESSPQGRSAAALAIAT